jgi:hypothetical protein
VVDIFGLSYLQDDGESVYDADSMKVLSDGEFLDNEDSEEDLECNAEYC